MIYVNDIQDNINSIKVGMYKCRQIFSNVSI